MSQLKQRLEEAEAERDKLLEELKGAHSILASDSEDMDEMLDFPGMHNIIQKPCHSCTTHAFLCLSYPLSGLIYFFLELSLQRSCSLSAPEPLALRMR